MFYWPLSLALLLALLAAAPGLPLRRGLVATPLHEGVAP
jgi:hypothetical protein